MGTDEIYATVDAPVMEHARVILSEYTRTALKFILDESSKTNYLTYLNGGAVYKIFSAADKGDGQAKVLVSALSFTGPTSDAGERPFAVLDNALALSGPTANPTTVGAAAIAKLNKPVDGRHSVAWLADKGHRRRWEGAVLPPVHHDGLLWTQEEGHSHAQQTHRPRLQ